ncbi:MAG: prepilin-type N-terminal cleavage/methylation domain-containing protein [Halothece sp. Uz-M2-17]|nr:prepilin-type N-terminal cleavage/methylation domain-containing protein [Halothece sp. Uz-M2-17]
MKHKVEQLTKLYFYFLSSSQPSQGFTLTELLVAVFAGGIIISTLLAQTVDFLKIDLKDSAQANTQQEMRNALNFIARDLREAVYVYDGTELAALESHLPDFGSNRKPIIAFWKIERLPYIEDSDSKYQLPGDCENDTLTDNNSDGDLDEERTNCKNLKIERSTYTLVTYIQNTTGPSASTVWQGQSRLERFELRKYQPDALDKLTRTTGYIDPRQESTFADWPNDPITLSSLQSNLPTDTAETLVDFVAAYNDASITASSCPTNYTRTPTDSNYKSFYACVRSSTADNAINQDVTLYLTGNAYGQSGILDQNAYVPQLETQVISRGVIDKNPTN